MALLELEAGDVFEFHKWQQDIDRLREEYHEAELLRGRACAAPGRSSDDGRPWRSTIGSSQARSPSSSSKVTRSNPSSSRTIREAWRRTIFDRFLLEDIRTRILRHLIEEDIIGSKVEAVVAVVDARAQADSRHRHGRDARCRRRIGSLTPATRAFDADRLDAVVVRGRPRASTAGWTPSARRGHRDLLSRPRATSRSRVKADEPVGAGAGRRAAGDDRRGTAFRRRVADVPRCQPEPAGRRGGGGPAGFRRAVRDRRDRCGAAARRGCSTPREGFNTVQIEVERGARIWTPATSRSSLRFSKDCSRCFARSRRKARRGRATGVIRRALRLRIGAPVNLADWSQARKRMYDTNVFRQVDIEPVPIEPTTEESAAGIQPVRAVVRVVEYPGVAAALRRAVQRRTKRGARCRRRHRACRTSASWPTSRIRMCSAARSPPASPARYERSRQAGSLFTSNGSFFGLPIRSSGFVFTSRQRFVDQDVTTIDQRFGVSAEQRWRPFRLLGGDLELPVRAHHAFETNLSRRSSSLRHHMSRR